MIGPCAPVEVRLAEVAARAVDGVVRVFSREHEAVLERRPCGREEGTAKSESARGRPRSQGEAAWAKARAEAETEAEAQAGNRPRSLGSAAAWALLRRGVLRSWRRALAGGDGQPGLVPEDLAELLPPREEERAEDVDPAEEMGDGGRKGARWARGQGGAAGAGGATREQGAVPRRAFERAAMGLQGGGPRLPQEWQRAEMPLSQSCTSLQQRKRAAGRRVLSGISREIPGKYPQGGDRSMCLLGLSSGRDRREP